MISFINKYYKIILIAIILIALFSRITPFESRSWVMDADTQIIREALNIGQGIFEKDFSFLQNPTKYPFIMPYILLFFYGIFYLIGIIFGFISNAQEFVNFVFFNLENFYWFSRLVISCFAVANVFLIYKLTLKLTSLINLYYAKVSALLAAFLLAIDILSIQFGQQPRSHIAMVFFVLLTFNFLFNFLQHKKIKSYFLIALSSSLALGCIQSGFFALIFLAIASFSILKNKIFKKRILVILTAIVILATIFLLSYPYIFFESNAISQREIGSSIDFSLSKGEEQVYTFNAVGSKAVLEKSLNVFPGLMLLILILCLSAVFLRKKIDYKLISKNNFIIFIYTLGFVVFYLIILILYGGTTAKYFIPLIPFFCLIIGVLFTYLAGKITKNKVLIFLICLILVFNLSQAIYFVWLLNQDFTRDEAKDWIENNISLDKLIVLQNGGPILIPCYESLILQQQVQSSSLSKKDEFLLSLSDSDYPENCHSLVNLGKIGSNFKTEYEFLNFIQGIEAKYFILTYDSHTSEDFFNYDYIRQYGQSIALFMPYKKEISEEYIGFPGWLVNPVINLWNYKQFGPVVDIYELNFE